MFSIVLMIAILVDIKWYLIMALICISPMNSDVEHLFKWLVTICIASLEKYLVECFACLIICLFVLELYVTWYFLFLPFIQGSPTSGPWTNTSCQISSGIRLKKIKSTIQIMCLNHPEPSLSTSVLGTNCHLWKWSLVPKRLGTAAYEWDLAVCTLLS